MKNNIFVKISALVSIVSGFVILFSAIYPIVSYEKLSKEKYQNFLSPLVSSARDTGFYSADYTKASNWFVGETKSVLGDASDLKVNSYKISIPKLGIKDAMVRIGEEDLSENLIHFSGTALPGKTGNSVIFGHSILPQFFNSEDYLSIFSTLPTLEKGDEIFIYYDGISFKYEVVAMYEVLPTEIEVLDQPTDDSYVTLVTCVPPGHPLKPRRLVVRTKVVLPDL